MEFEQRHKVAQRPPPPDLLAGLTEAGKRNRAQQRQEQIQKVELDLERHRKSPFCARNKAGE